MNAKFHMQLKRKPEVEDTEVAESSEWTHSPGYAETNNNPMLTPVSGKGGRICGRSKVSKYSKSGPQTPISDAGENSFNLCLIFFHLKLWNVFLLSRSSNCYMP